MVGITATLTYQTPVAEADAATAPTVRAADKALNALLKNPQLLQSLADHSAQYVPPSKSAILSVLWALVNVDGGGFVTRDGVQRAVFAEGGGTVAVDALWNQLNPGKKSSISAADFAVNNYLNEAVTLNLEVIREDVDLQRIKSATAGNSTSLLDFMVGGADNVLQNFSGNTGTVLDLFS